jgi:tripartite-type tricarboxylate transporter receptor subunit TctC
MKFSSCLQQYFPPLRKEKQMKTVACIVIGFVFACVLIRWGNDVQAAGSDYPSRPINVIVPFPAGGVTDLSARALAESMERHLKQSVIVVNKVGGGTTTGGYALVSAKPDGYTLGFFPTGTIVAEAFTFFQDAPYTSRDIKPVSGVVLPVLTIAVREDAPWNSFKELVEYSKKNPGLKVGTAGKQAFQHMFVTMLNKIEKTGFVPVNFAGDAATLPALLGGHVPVAGFDYSTLKSLAEAKRVKVLVVLTYKRAEFAPDIPTAMELGYSHSVPYFPLLGLIGPKNIPAPVVEKLERAVADVCADQEFHAKMRNIPLQIMYQNSADFEKVIKKNRESIMSYFKDEGMLK